MCRINPRVDFALKKLFGSEENKDIFPNSVGSMYTGYILFKSKYSIDILPTILRQIVNSLLLGLIFLGFNKVSASAHDFNQILCGLSESYILNSSDPLMKFDSNFKILNIDICDYAKYSDNPNLFSKARFDTSSYIYFYAYNKFINSDQDCIDSLIQYEKDSSQCTWIRRINFDMSVRNPIVRLVSYKYIASLILICNYLSNSSKKYIEIPGIENDLKLVYKTSTFKQDSLYLPCYPELKQWYSKNKNLTIGELKQEFKKFNSYMWYYLPKRKNN